jgi:hypothetical protein
LTAWQKRKQEEITHPYLEEKIPLGFVPYTQAMLLARHIRGDIEDYPPFSGNRILSCFHTKFVSHPMRMRGLKLEVGGGWQ